MKRSLLIGPLFILSLVEVFSQQHVFPEFSGPYLGQQPPGMKPEIFAPGIINTGLYTRDIAISKDGNEIYFSVSDAGIAAIFVTKIINEQWTEPVIAEFSGKGFMDIEPCLSPDGNKLFFLSNRPKNGMKPRIGWYYQDIWVVNRTSSGWNEPQPLDSPVNTDEEEFFPSMTRKNILYFTRKTKNGNMMICRSGYENGKFNQPDILQFSLPERGIIFNAFISPNEDFLITCALNIDSTNIDQDYYISFRTEEGKWSELVKFGPEINNPGDNANSAYVSPDGKYLFFGSLRRSPGLIQKKDGTPLSELVKLRTVPGNGYSSIYWVDAKIIEKYRPGDNRPILTH